MTDRVPVAVTGLGAVTAYGPGTDALERGLRAGRCAIARRPRDGGAAEDWPEVGGFLVDPTGADLPARIDQFIPGLSRRVGRWIRDASPGVRATLAAAVEAAHHAGLPDTAEDAARTGLIVGGSNLSQVVTRAALDQFERAPAYVNPRYGYQFLDSHLAATLAAALGVCGPAFTVGGATASGLFALAAAVDMLRAGRAEACVVVGPMADLTALEWRAFAAMGALAPPDSASEPAALCRPFDAGARGFVAGAGAGAVVVETRERARRRGIAPLAEIAGVGLATEGEPLPDPSVEGERRAMREALAEAGTAASDVDYVNAHATSTPSGDRAEAEAIADLFADTAPGPWVNATKGLIGHTLFAAGTVGLIATIVQMRGGFLHPNLNLETPVDARLRLVGPETAEARVGCALCNAFGFGGLHASALVKAAGTAP